MYKKYFSLLLLFVAPTLRLYNAQKIPGDMHGDTSFSFTLGSHAFCASQSRLFVGAQEEIPGNHYALSCAGLTFEDNRVDVFAPLAIKEVTLNGKKKQPNPLTGARIKHLCILEDWPVVVTGSSCKLYVIDDFSGNYDDKQRKININHVNIIASKTLHDAGGDPARDVLGLTASYPYIFVALKPSDQSLENQAFDVALGLLYDRSQKKIKKDKEKKQEDDESNSKDQKDEKKTDPALTLLDTQTGAGGQNKATRLDTTSDLIAIQGPAASLNTTSIQPYWADTIDRLYVPFHITGGPDVNDGVRGLVVGFVKNRILSLHPIAPPSAISDDSIIGARGPNSEVSLVQVRSMGTTTGLTYIIVVGGVGNPEKVSSTISALPVVRVPDEKLTGTIAMRDQLPVEEFSPDYPEALLRRSFTVPATKPEHMPHASDAAVIVGRGNLPGPVTDIVVQGDAVFASVAWPEYSTTDTIDIDPLGRTSSSDQEWQSVTFSQTRKAGQAGIFHSQALFDKHGRIRQWTAWKRVSGDNRPLAGFAYDPLFGRFWHLVASAHQKVQDVLYTQWDKVLHVGEHAMSPLAHHVNALFAQVPSRIQDVQVYPPQTPGLCSLEGQQLSLLIATGYERVVLIETGNDQNGFFEPVKSFEKAFESTNASLKDLYPETRSMTMTGGALSELGPIVASALATDGKNGWLFVAGSGGIAVLTNPDGTGWPVGGRRGLTSGLKELSRMKFVKLGSYEHVHKLISDKGKLFIVTPTSFSCIELSAGLIKQGTRAQDTLLARTNMLEGHTYFLDALVSQGVVLLGTSGGLLRLKRNVHETEITQADWESVDIPYSAGAVSAIFALGPSGQSHDAADHGNVYLINSSASNDQSRIYRYVLNNHELTLFPDAFTKQSGPSFFINLGFYRGFLAIDGAAALLTASAFAKTSPAVELMRIDDTTHHKVYFNTARTSIEIKSARDIGPVVREPASGAWLAWGDFGITAYS